MKRFWYLIVLACGAPLFGAYTYYLTENWGSTISGNWTQNGTISASGGLTSASANGGSLISNAAVPDGSAYYEVKTTLTLTQSGGNYITYLHATSNALSGPATTGTFYAIELQNPTFNGSSCTATLAVYKVINAAVTLLAASTVPCRNGMVIRAVYGSYNYLPVYVDNFQYALLYDQGIMSGQPGVGVRGAPAGNGIQQAALGPHDVLAPAPVNTQLIGTGIFSNRVDMQWNSASDDANGVGVGWYQIVRNGAWIANLRGTSTFTDSTVTFGTAYTYVIYAWDYHMNYSTASFNVTTPPQNEIEARQTGVRPTGSYWGGGGENIDMRSGNLNYTIPLVKAMGRGGWGVGFNLTYNSQNWRYDPNGYWQLGRDLGYGYGWKLLAGSLTPFYSDYWTLDHYLFTDGTGAEYRLDVANADGTWQSKEGVYLYYDPNSTRLYFRDGTFWVMDSASSGTEQDSGTVYPSKMQDTNGNQILIHYNTGQGVSWPESSSRIASIEDVRGKGFVDYTFTYNGDPIPHLTSITNTIGTAEKYSFGVTSGQLFYPDTNTPYGNSSFLTSVTQTGPNLTTTLTNYPDGDLNQVATPYGGHLRWEYGWVLLSGGRYYREVQNRYLFTNNGVGENQYTLQRLGSDVNQSIHTYADWFDWSGNAEKVWWFQTGTTATNAGLGIGMRSAVTARATHCRTAITLGLWTEWGTRILRPRCRRWARFRRRRRRHWTTTGM